MRSRVLLFLLALVFTGQAQVMNVRKWRDSERDSLDNALNLVDEAYYDKALPYFEHLLANHPGEAFLKYSYAKCALFRGDRQHESYDIFTEIAQKIRKIPDVQFDMALAAFYSHRFEEADKYLDKYLSDKKTRFDGGESAATLQRYIINAKSAMARPTQQKVSALGEAVNSEYDEINPALGPRNRVLLFTYKGPRSKGGLQYEDLGQDIRHRDYLSDIFSTSRERELFAKAKPLDSLNTIYEEKLLSVSADGRALLLYQDIGDGHGDIYLSAFNGRFFGTPQLLRGAVNGYSREKHAALSPDGKTLYFSSDRPGGHGGMDLYRASLGADSVWTNIVNLGPAVNTKEDEDFPFIHADGLTFFFSSRGHNSMGGYDIFSSRMDVKDSTFIAPENLGYPLNGTSDDICFILDAQGNNGFFSSARSTGMGQSDIFQARPRLSSPVDPVYIIRGDVKSGGTIPAAIITIEQGGANRTNYTTIYTDTASGQYLAVLRAGSTYTLSCWSEGMGTSSFTVDTRKLTVYTEKTHNFELASPLVSSEPLAPTPPETVNTTIGNSAPPVSHTTVAWPDKDGFEPNTLLQKKAMRYRERYGDISAEGLEFRVQFAALKGQGNLYFPKLSRYGRIERLRLDDGYTRLTLGGSFKTLRKAFEMNKKAIRGGEEEAYVIALYKGKKVEFEELERMGVFK